MPLPQPRWNRRLGDRGSRVCVGVALVVFALASPCAGASANVLERLSDYLSGLETLQAQFHQVTFNADRTQMVESDGELYLQRPGKFRWEYHTPFVQEIIADGKRVYVHDPELEQVYHRSQEEALRGTPALLLTKDEPIEELFDVAPIEGGQERDWVELRPKEADSQIERIELGFDGERLDTMVMVDGFGQVTHLRFTDIRRNRPLAAELFVFDHSIGGDFLQFE